MKVLDSFANIPKVLFDFFLWEMTIPKSDFVIEASGFGILEDHIGGIFFLFVVVVNEFDDTGMIQFMVNIDFLFCIPAMNLSYHFITILIATISLV